MDKRCGRAKWGPNGTRRMTSDAYWQDPLKWDRTAKKDNARRRVFCASLADVFEDWQGGDYEGEMSCSRTGEGLSINKNGHVWPMGWPSLSDGDDWGARAYTMVDARSRLFRLIDRTPNLDWLLLTKRPENIKRMWPNEGWVSETEYAQMVRENVWLGTSVSDRETATKAITELVKNRNLAKNLFLSIEPLTGPIDDLIGDLLEPHLMEQVGEFEEIHRDDCPCRGTGKTPRLIDWVIVGGESGPNARPCNVEWIRSIVQQCTAANVPCFVKQLGANMVFGDGFDPNVKPSFNGWRVLQDKKGGDPAEWPKDLRVREIPEPSLT